jgi:hypothetical protein
MAGTPANTKLTGVVTYTVPADNIYIYSAHAITTAADARVLLDGDGQTSMGTGGSQDIYQLTADEAQVISLTGSGSPEVSVSGLLFPK